MKLHNNIILYYPSKKGELKDILFLIKFINKNTITINFLF